MSEKSLMDCDDYGTRSDDPHAFERDLGTLNAVELLTKYPEIDEEFI